MLMTYKMSSKSFSTAPTHDWSLHRTNASLFFPTGFHNVSASLSRNNNQLYLFLHALLAFYEQANSRMQNLQIPVTAESRVPLAWIFAINHNQRDRLTFRPDAILVTPKKTCNINPQNQQNHHNNQGLTLRSGRRVVLATGEDSLAAAAAAGGRPLTPATAYQPRQTRPENLPWQRRTTHLIKIKFREDTRHEQQLQAVHAQHGQLRRSIAGGHVLHVILLGVGGVFYIPHTLVPLKNLGLDSHRVKKLALKLHAHSVHYSHKLVQTRRFLEHSPHLQINQERSAGLSARNPPDPH